MAGTMKRILDHLIYPPWRVRRAFPAATLKAISKRPAAFPAVAVTSAEKGGGLPELRAEIMRTTGMEL